MTPGIHYGVPMADYLALEALSATPVRTFMDECPYAGWHVSRMNPDREREEANDAMDRGSIAHEIFLEQSAECVVVIDPEDHVGARGATPKGWTNDSIRAARDAARAAGKSPILKSKFAAVQDMVVETARFVDSLKAQEPALWRMFADADGGDSEVVMVWQEGEILCKLRADRISKDFRICCDYKTSGASVEPDRWGRAQLTGMGYAFDAAWYRRGIRAVTGVDTEFVFLAQECDAPYLCSLVGLDPAWRALGDAKVQAGLAAWRQCLASGEWPKFPSRVCYPELPPWESAKFEEQIANSGSVLDYGKLTGRPSIEELVK